MGRVLFIAGAQEVLTGLARHPVARTVAELGQINRPASTAELHLAAFNPTGSVRMGAHPQHAPLDPHGRLRGTAGLYVSDAATLPTCPEVNPSMTIMAMALSVADHAVAEDQGSANL